MTKQKKGLYSFEYAMWLVSVLCYSAPVWADNGNQILIDKCAPVKARMLEQVDLAKDVLPGSKELGAVGADAAAITVFDAIAASKNFRNISSFQTFYSALQGLFPKLAGRSLDMFLNDLVEITVRGWADPSLFLSSNVEVPFLGNLIRAGEVTFTGESNKLILVRRVVRANDPGRRTIQVAVKESLGINTKTITKTVAEMLINPLQSEPYFVPDDDAIKQIVATLKGHMFAALENSFRHPPSRADNTAKLLRYFLRPTVAYDLNLGTIRALILRTGLWLQSLVQGARRFGVKRAPIYLLPAGVVIYGMYHYLDDLEETIDEAISDFQTKHPSATIKNVEWVHEMIPDFLSVKNPALARRMIENAGCEDVLPVLASLFSLADAYK